MDDAELLALIREHHPGPVVAAIVVAHRAGRGGSTGGLIEATGYTKSGVLKGVRWLDDHAPAWRNGAGDLKVTVMPLLELGSLAEAEAPHVEVELVTLADVELVDDAIRESAPPSAPARRTRAPRASGPVPWRAYLHEREVAMEGRRSWDLYRDIYGPAANRLFAEGCIGDLVALTIDYVENVTGDEADNAEKKRIAQVVHKHGKAALHGLHEAIGHTEDMTVGTYVKYALAVCKNTTTRLRNEEADHADQERGTDDERG